MHWSEKYLSKPWSKSSDCWDWFRKIQKDEFGVDVLRVPVNPKNTLLTAARYMKGDVEDVFGWVETKEPKDGDAVFLSQRSYPHHIGIVAVVDGETKILHALEGVGIVVSSLSSLRINGWKVAGYWQWKS